MSETTNPLRQLIQTHLSAPRVIVERDGIALEEREILENLLDSMKVTELRKIAKRRVWSLSGTRKDGIVEQMATHMLDSRNNPDMLTQLSGNELLLLSATHTLFNINTMLYLDQYQFVWQHLLGKSGSARRHVSALADFGLLYEIEDMYDDGGIYRPLLPLSEKVLPVMSLLPHKQTAVSPKPRPIFPATPLLTQIERIVHFLLAGGQLTPAKQEGVIDQEHENIYVGNWPHLPEEVEDLPQFSPFHYFTSPPELSVPLPKHVVDEATFRTLIDVVSNWDTLDFIVQLLLTVGLLQKNERRQFVIEGSLWQAYLALSETEQKELWWALLWQRSGDLYELRLLLRETTDLELWRVAHPDLPFETLIGETVLARQTILRLLRGLAEDEARRDVWHSFTDFRADLHRYRNDLFHDLTGSETWGFKMRGMKLDEDLPENWIATIGQMVRVMFVGPLYWMNVVELSMEQGKVSTFRLTPNGRFLLSPFVEEMANVEGGGANGRFEWLDERTFQLLPGRNTNAIMGVVSRLGESVPNEVRTYRLSEAKLVQAFGNGDDPTLLANQFAKAGFPLPPEALAFVQDVYGRFGHVHLYEKLTLIEFADDAALVELRAAGLLEGVIVYEFSPRLIVIWDEEVDELMSKLTDRGYTPRQTESIA